MLKKIIHFLFVPIGAALGYWLWVFARYVLTSFDAALWDWIYIALEVALILALAFIGYLVGAPLSNRLTKKMGDAFKIMRAMPAHELFMSTMGLLIGLVCAFLICQVFRNISNEILVTSINAIIYICFSVIGLKIGRSRRDDFDSPLKKKKNDNVPLCGGTVLDTSILIDGRAFDIFKSGFLAKPVLIPKFVLDELSRLSDSEDGKKRTRGRIGLDTVKNLRAQGVTISQADYPQFDSIDDKIVAFAKENNAYIMTNDYSLNLVASVQGVQILNVNELVNALKPTLITGDEIELEIVKVGKDPSQGIGYLDDGTMIVVDNASGYVDKSVTVVVTGMIQTNAGKIIFGKVK